MKRSTCKVLLWIGIFLLLFFLLISILYGTFFIFISNPLVWIAIILIIIALAKWNSEEEVKDVKEAQLQALKRGKVNVELKGKMKKLK